MSALQDLASCQLVHHPGFAVKNFKRRKITAIRQRTEQETSTAKANEDRGLIDQVLAGDSAAQSRLFETYSPRLYRVAFSVLRNKEDAEDAVQDGWCRAYSKLHTFEGRSSLSTWLTRIVINSALMIRRKNKYQSLTSLDEISDDAKGLQQYLVDRGRTPEEACADGEMKELLLRQIQRLPSPTRTAFLLRDVDELSTAESNEKLGINRSTLKSRVQRARGRIAQNIRQLLHVDRSRNSALVSADCCVANRSSAIASSTREAGDGRI
jgi:RNA polymerase sigma-70 factor (ECF subfamily)